MKRRYSEWDWVDLSEEEIDDALGYRRFIKGSFMQEQEKKEMARIKILKEREPWTYDQLKAEVMDRSKREPFEFVIDENNERVIDLLCLYFSGDPSFDNEKIEYKDGSIVSISLKKGIGLISAKKGTGKSILMKLFQQNKYRPYLKIDTKDVASLYKLDGHDAIIKHSNLIHVPPMPLFFYYEKVGLCFDELGYELPKNNWGDKSDVMADVLFNIYRNNQETGDYSNFHFTSNLSGNDFENRYGDRIRDRMREMFNVIVVPGESRRK